LLNGLRISAGYANALEQNPFRFPAVSVFAMPKVRCVCCVVFELYQGTKSPGDLEVLDFGAYAPGSQHNIGVKWVAYLMQTTFATFPILHFS